MGKYYGNWCNFLGSSILYNFFWWFIYLKIPQKINDVLSKLISDIKNEIDESEKLRLEAKKVLY